MGTVWFACCWGPDQERDQERGVLRFAADGQSGVEVGGPKSRNARGLKPKKKEYPVNETTIEQKKQAPEKKFEHIGQRLSKLEGGPLRLWVALWGHTNYRTRLCSPGYRRLSLLLGCCYQSVQNWIQILVESKWLKVEKTKCRTGERNIYTILNGEGKAFYCVRTLTVLPRKNARQRSTTVEQERSTRVEQNSSPRRRKGNYSFSPTSRRVAGAPSSSCEGAALVAALAGAEAAEWKEDE